MSTRSWSLAGALFLALWLPVAAEAGPVLFESSGANAAAIQATVDSFRALGAGAPNNANNPGPLATGRREINWDGGGATTTATAGPSFAAFKNTRGALFTTSGTGFLQTPLVETTGPGDVTLSESVGNATYATAFSTFSNLRLFTPIASNVMDATFFIPGPGSQDPAGVSSFGAVFTDVDLFGPTMIEFFGKGGKSLFSRSVLAAPGDGSLSFLGVQFTGGELITRARITTGTAALGPNDNPGGGVDVVAMDDFLYGEPQDVPEPGTIALLALGALVTGAARRRNR
jgi:hypothetical protein